ncbi:MAG: hypothetical protein WAX57_02290, partial [Minisyncoccia bacterium]
MSSEITHEGIQLVPSRDAARRFGITNDYIGRLCKSGKVVGRIISGSWYVNEESLRGFLLTTNREKYERRDALRQMRVNAYREAQEARANVKPKVQKVQVIRVPRDVVPEEVLRLHPVPRSIPKSVTNFVQRGLATMFVLIVFIGGLRFSDASVFQAVREMLPATASISGRGDLFARGSQSALANILGLGSEDPSYWIWYVAETGSNAQPQNVRPSVAESTPAKPIIQRVVEAVAPAYITSGISEALLSARLAALEQR